MLERFEELEGKVAALLERIEQQARRIERLENERDELLEQLEESGLRSDGDAERNEQIRKRLQGLIERIDRVESEVAAEEKPDRKKGANG